MPSRPPYPNLLAAKLVLCGLAAFAPTVGSYFLADDFVLLGWTRTTSPGEVLAFFDPSTFWFYRPMVKVVYWASQSLFGLNPLPLHLASLALHGANGYLVYRLALRLGAGWPGSLACALLFLLNRHHAETVSWAAAIGDLLAALCILSALLLFDRFCTRGSPLYLLASLALFVVGLLTRETAVMLPLLLLAYTAVFVRMPRARPGTRKALLARVARLAVGLGAFLGLLLVYAGLLMLGRGEGGGVARGGLQLRALSFDSVLLGVVDYVHGLVPAGGRLADLPLETLRWLVWLEVLVLLALALLLWRLRLRPALFGLLSLLVTPLLFVFFSGPTDRYFYLPSIGYALLVGSLAGRLAGTRVGSVGPVGQAARWASAAIVLGILGLQFRGLLAEEASWREAGRATGQFFSDVQRAEPEPRDYSAFFFVDLPPVMGDVPAFQNSLPQAVQLMYDNSTLAASSVTCGYLDSQPELPRYSLFFRFRDGHAQQFASVAECR